MALYRKLKQVPYDVSKSSNKNTPYSFFEEYPEVEIDFVNAYPEDTVLNSIYQSLSEIDNSNSNPELIQNNTFVTNLPSISNHKGVDENNQTIFSPVPIFMGNSDAFTKQFLYFNPELRNVNPSTFFQTTDCEHVFLFNNLLMETTLDRGIAAPAMPSCPVPSLQPETVTVTDVNCTDIDLLGYQQLTGGQQVIGHYHGQTYIQSTTQLVNFQQVQDKIVIDVIECFVASLGRGIQLINSKPMNFDTWYDGNWESFNLGNNVGTGYSKTITDDSLIKDRYKWSFGSIFLTKSLGTLLQDDSIVPPNKFSFKFKTIYTTEHLDIRLNYIQANIEQLDIFKYNPADNTVFIQTPSSYDKNIVFTVAAAADLELINLDENFGYREVGYQFTNSDIKLIGWNYSFDDGVETTLHGYGPNRRSSLLKKFGSKNFDKHPEVAEKVYGRQVLSYFMKTLEEGKCIRINEKNNGIEISVDFLYNGICCNCIKVTPPDPSSSSSSSLSSNSSSSSGPAAPQSSSSSSSSSSNYVMTSESSSSSSSSSSSLSDNQLSNSSESSEQSSQSSVPVINNGININIAGNGFNNFYHPGEPVFIDISSSLSAGNLSHADIMVDGSVISTYPMSGSNEFIEAEYIVSPSPSAHLLCVVVYKEVGNAYASDCKPIYVNYDYSIQPSSSDSSSSNSSSSSSSSVANCEGALTDWYINGGISGGAAIVNTQVFSNDFSTLYIAGNFTSVGGVPRKNIAAINVASKKVTSWYPKNGVDNTVHSMITCGSNLLVAGDFTRIGNTTRNRIAAVDLNTAQVASWYPMNGANSTIYTMKYINNTLYIGGNFIQIGNQFRNRIAALVNDQVTTFCSSSNGIYFGTNGPVYTIENDNSNNILIGGYFNMLNGISREKIASVEPVSGNINSWYPVNGITGTLQYVNVLKKSLDNTKIYVGGQFSNVGTLNRNNIAALDISTGHTVSWYPMDGITGSGQYVNDILLDAGVVFVVGEYDNIGGVSRQNISLIDNSTASVDYWYPHPYGVNGEIKNILLSNDKLNAFIVGNFTEVNTEIRNSIANLCNHKYG